MCRSPFDPNGPRSLDRTFVPHNVMPIHGNPGPLFQIAPRLTFLTYSWSKNEDTKYYSISKSPVNKPPLNVPQGGSLYREIPVSRAFFYLSSDKNEILPFKVPSKRAPLLVYPTGPLYREMPVSRAFFYLSPDKNEILPFSQSPQ